MPFPKSRWLPLTSITALIVLMACNGVSKKSNHEASRVQHDFGVGVIGTEKVLWSDVSEDDFFRLVMPLTPGNPWGALQNQDGYMTREETIQQRLQFWLDQLDAAARQMVGTKAAAIPKPVLKIAKEEFVNAFVAPVATCLDNVSVKISGKSGDKTLAKGGLFGSEIQNAEGDMDGCVTQNLQTQQELDRIMEYLRVTNEGCQFTASTLAGERFEISVSQASGGTCAAATAEDGITGFQQLLQPATSNHILITLQAVIDQPEESVVFMIAHELAHYYRAHPVFLHNPALFGFYYQVGETGKDGRPSASADSAIQAFAKEFDALKKEELALEQARAPFGMWDPEDPVQKDFPKKWDEYTAQLKIVRDRLQALETDALAKNVGWYTYEQEADELGLEIYNRLGFRPEAAINFALSLDDRDAAVEEIQKTGEWFDWRKQGFIGGCRKLYNNQWQQNGKVQVQNVGSFKEPHHTACFRAYNLWLETEAHASSLNSTRGNLPALPESLQELTWQQIQTEAVSINEAYAKVASARFDASGTVIIISEGVEEDSQK